MLIEHQIGIYWYKTYIYMYMYMYELLNLKTFLLDSYLMLTGSFISMLPSIQMAFDKTSVMAFLVTAQCRK